MNININNIIVTTTEVSPGVSNVLATHEAIALMARMAVSPEKGHILEVTREAQYDAHPRVCLALVVAYDDTDDGAIEYHTYRMEVGFMAWCGALANAIEAN